MYYGLINSMNKTVAPSYTARTTAFATATGITDVTILGALNTFDLGLISNGLDTKMKAVYPMVGTTSTTQKYNFMDARDLDIAFRLSFIGGATFSSTGYLPNGINAYANSFLNVSTNLSLNSTHISTYIRTNNLSGSVSIAADMLSGSALNIFPNYIGSSYFRMNASGSGAISTGGNSLGLFLGNRISSTETRNRKNATQYVQSSTSSGLANANVWIASSPDNPIFYANEICFSSIGLGLSDSESLTFYNLVQAMQTTLSRQV